MDKFLAVIAFLFGLVGMFSVGALVWGISTDAFAEGAEMATLMFQLFGVIAAVSAVVMGLLSRVMGKREKRDPSKIANFGMILGILTFLGHAGASIFG